jgi:hypothetical protein
MSFKCKTSGATSGTGAANLPSSQYGGEGYFPYNVIRRTSWFGCKFSTSIYQYLIQKVNYKNWGKYEIIMSKETRIFVNELNKVVELIK